ncbi:hypothetical protein Cgig2_009116 [Carnegiea gigantea]|uniref:Uncharacterized protein n=1 Tax=Carnegiea gigantea TaxID=171969 RepID=A0A9Q1GMI6_9CARY|nr:hypothetical protein Cgig2_009116 [Carnegiea gigantea]
MAWFNWALKWRELREAGFTEQRSLPALVSGRIMSRCHPDLRVEGADPSEPGVGLWRGLREAGFTEQRSLSALVSGRIMSRCHPDLRVEGADPSKPGIGLWRGLREAGFTEQRSLPALVSGRIMSRCHPDLRLELLSLSSEGPGSGYLVIQDRQVDEYVSNCFARKLKATHIYIKDVPFPQSRPLDVKTSGSDHNCYSYTFFIPVTDQPCLSTVTMLAYTSAREEDGNCPFMLIKEMSKRTAGEDNSRDGNGYSPAKRVRVEAIRWALKWRELREAGLTEQRSLPALVSGRTTSQCHLDPMVPS